MAHLELPPMAGQAESPRAKKISGNLYHLPENDGPIQAVGLEVGDETTLLLRIDDQDRRSRRLGLVGSDRQPGLRGPIHPRHRGAGRHERGLDRRRHVHGEGVLLQEPVLRHDAARVRRGPPALRPGDERGLRAHEASAARGATGGVARGVSPRAKGWIARPSRSRCRSAVR